MTDETQLTVGTPAPSFTLNDQNGSPVSLTDFRGQKVILFFYPQADTPGCTKEACDFRDNLTVFRDAGYVVLGISRDKPEKQARFDAHHSLGITLLSDPDLTTHDAFGAYGLKNMYGKLLKGVKRSTFVVDENGVISLALYNVKATGHVASLTKKLGLAHS